MTGTRPERILVLNYNTIFFQSVGFIDRMLRAGLTHPLYSKVDQFGHIYLAARSETRNTASLLDPGVTEDSYFEFIRKHYRDVTVSSPETEIAEQLQLACGQTFVERLVIAGVEILPEVEATLPRAEQVVLDIFDVRSVESFIEANDITSVFIHDVDMVYDIVCGCRIDIETVSFFLSKLTYNFKSVGEKLQLKHPVLLDLCDELNFNLAYANLHDTTRGFLSNEI
jgi:hypothetical protein